MGSSVWKDIIREIKTSFGRFFAIFGIVAMGVAFFAGITASSTDMKYSSDLYYDSNNLMDFRLVSTIGFSEDDVTAIRNTEGVNGVFATHSVDVLTQVDRQDAVVHVMTVPDSNLTEENEDYINQPRLIEGRLPENEGECVIRRETAKEMPAELGGTITITSGDGTDLNDTLKNQTLTVVGIVETPYYINYDIGDSEIGNGSISYVVMVRDSEFVQDYDTEVFVTANGAKALDTYSQEYSDLIDEVSEHLKETGTQQIADRVEAIEDSYNEAKSSAELNVYSVIGDQVRKQLEEKYATYYPGYDVSDMVDEVYNAAYERAVLAYDFTDLYAKYDSAKEEALENSADWKWYVLDRSMLASYREYESSADRMAAIATVFPLFFFFVAALVCLTTMTRMVDEERGLIGVYKALGYGRSVIALKYLVYAFTASIVGGLIGCLVGLKLFPTVIYNAWGILYRLPPISYTSHYLLSLIAIGSMVLVTCVSAYFACYSQLAEVPSELMRPKAPKAGKKILLEHIPLLWKRISFSGKVTARNVFRYKKRFFMTVLGVAGCSALLLAGYGIKDSITGLLVKQFDEIQNYDYVLTMDTDADQDQFDAMLESMKQQSEVTASYALTCYSSETGAEEFTAIDDAMTVQAQDHSATISIVPDIDTFQQFVTLRSRTKKETYELGEDGVCITEKLANDLGVKAGDSVYIQSEAGVVKAVTIAHVVEMYVDHDIYMSESYYNKVFGETIEPNTVLGRLSDTGDTQEAQTGEYLLQLDGVKSITFITANLDKFDSMIQSLNSVTYVLILSAAFLAFIVSYNLTNVNISERIREIATIKVLGFYDPEVSAYVFRENTIISIIGALAGLVLGVGLHAFIMKTIEMDRIMFGNQINFPSFLWAFALTMLFATLVNAIMYFKLKRIPMVESLKSVE